MLLISIIVFTSEDNYSRSHFLQHDIKGEKDKNKLKYKV
jgi:hypothetical protein